MGLGWGMTDEIEAMSPAEVQQRVDAWLAARETEGWFADEPWARRLVRAHWREVMLMYSADSSPAMGCLLALVRLAWGDETIVTSCRPGHEEAPRWTTMRWGGTAMRNLMNYTWPTEREALVAALVATSYCCAPAASSRDSVAR